MNSQDIQALIKRLENERKKYKAKEEETAGLIRLKELASKYSGEDEVVPFDNIVEKLRNEKEESKFMSGWSGLDDILKGFRPQQLIVVSALTKSGKCLAKGTEVLMSNGSIKKVEDIKVGDKVMGQDSKPRNVIALGSGIEKMYRIKQRGAEYVVNESHILSLKETGNSNTSRYAGRITSKRYTKGKILNISVKDFLQASGGIKHRYKGWKVGVEFNEQKTLLDPYFVGLWLGDGDTNSVRITSADNEIAEYLHDYANRQGLYLRVRKQKNNASKTYSITSGIAGGGDYSLQGVLREMDLLGNKHIPENYKVNSRENRLKLLAGLLDTDGSLTKNKYPYYDYITKLPILAKDIYFLASSLGFQVSIFKCKKGIKERNFVGDYYRVSISGDLSNIPVKIKRKKSNFIPQKDWQTSKIEIEDVGIGEYYGFELDGDGLFVLGNFVVTHNTSWLMDLTTKIADQNPVWFPFEESAEELIRKFIERKQEPPKGFTPSSMRGNTIEWIENKIIESIAKYNSKVVFIDQLDFIVPFNGDSHALRVGLAMRQLKAIAKRWNVTIFLICHLVKTSMDQQPTLEDLKGSSSIGQEADTVIILWREMKKEYGQVIITNNVNVSVQANRRTGTTGNVKMVYDNGKFYEQAWGDELDNF